MEVLLPYASRGGVPRGTQLRPPALNSLPGFPRSAEDFSDATEQVFALNAPLNLVSMCSRCSCRSLQNYTHPAYRSPIECRFMSLVDSELTGIQHSAMQNVYDSELTRDLNISPLSVIIYHLSRSTLRLEHPTWTI